MTLIRWLIAALVAALLNACGESASRGNQNGTPSAPRLLPKPYVAADQGDCVFAPENTLVAFRNGFRLGADDLEGDVNISADGVPVIIHDATLDRTTNCTGKVSDRTLAEIKACDAAYWWVPGAAPELVPVVGNAGEVGGVIGPLLRDPDDGRDYAMRGKGVTVPTVREFFDYVVSLGASLPQLTLEIKNIPYDSNFDPGGRVIADALVPLIEEYGLEDRIIVESFWPTSLQRVKALDPKIKTLFLTLASATENYAYVSLSADEYSSSDALATTLDYNQTYVNNVHALGKFVVPWAVDTAADMQKAAAFGVDGVLTCHVACLLESLGRPVTRPIVTPEAGVDYDVPAC